MPKFKMIVHRSIWGTCSSEVEVEAANESEAAREAEQYYWSLSDADINLEGDEVISVGLADETITESGLE